MDPFLRFLCILVGVVCLFVLAALDGFSASRYQHRHWLLPFGLAMIALPWLWDAGEAAF